MSINTTFGVNNWNTLDDNSRTNSLCCDEIECLKKAAIVHKTARKHLQNILNQKENISYTEICEIVENKVNNLFASLENTQTDIPKGMGFPVGISVNNIAAHDSANIIDNRKLDHTDIVKIDFGTHYNGYIIDSAFSLYFDNKFDNLAKATHEATMETIKMIKPDILVNELSKNIKEIIESYEIELDGKNYPIKAIQNLGGHSIKQYTIHGGALILCSPTDNAAYKTQRIQENTIYAIETFASTGKGFVVEDRSMECNHFMAQNINKIDPKSKLIFDISKKSLHYIKKERGTLPFSSRWVNKSLNTPKVLSGVNELVKKNIVQMYPPLTDIKGSYTSQYEHTIYIGENYVENLSVSNDY
jgi:methionyl aminopeptidase